MQAILKNVMASLLLLHAAFGCCLHCAHNCAGCENASPAGLVSTCCCSHHTQAPQQKTPCKCPLECHRLCVYVPTHKASVDGSDLLPFFAFLASDGTEWNSQLAVALSWERTHEPLATEPSVRLHLLHQLLLI